MKYALRQLGQEPGIYRCGSRHACAWDRRQYDGIHRVEPATAAGVAVPRPGYRDGAWYRVAARLKPGVTLQQAQTEMTAMALRMAHDFRKRTTAAKNRLRRSSDPKLRTMVCREPRMPSLPRRVGWGCNAADNSAYNHAACAAPPPVVVVNHFGLAYSTHPSMPRIFKILPSCGLSYPPTNWHTGCN